MTGDMRISPELTKEFALAECAIALAAAHRISVDDAMDLLCTAMIAFDDTPLPEPCAVLSSRGSWVEWVAAFIAGGAVAAGALSLMPLLTPTDIIVSAFLSAAMLTIGWFASTSQTAWRLRGRLEDLVRRVRK